MVIVVAAGLVGAQTGRIDGIRQVRKKAQTHCDIHCISKNKTFIFRPITLQSARACVCTLAMDVLRTLFKY